MTLSIVPGGLFLHLSDSAIILQTFLLQVCSLTKLLRDKTFLLYTLDKLIATLSTWLFDLNILVKLALFVSGSR